MSIPDKSPMEVFNILAGQDFRGFQTGLWRYYMDGPQMSPRHMWGPVALARHTTECFAPEGDVSDPITPETKWIRGF